MNRKRTPQGKAESQTHQKAGASVEEMSAESFPASDPPAFASGSGAGAPDHAIQDSAPKHDAKTGSKRGGQR